MSNHPVLYSYRRCPYAMRARVGLYLSGIQVEQREIVFWDKPEQMLQASPKGTVPVLVLPDGKVIDESRDIIFWALENRANHNLELAPSHLLDDINRWIDLNDNDFKEWLDKYKYADRFPEQSQEYYRCQALPFLNRIEESLFSMPIRIMHSTLQV
jgi:glutathione S-transferase